GQLTLTIGKYYRVTGGSTQNRGVLPDITLPSGVDPKEIGEDVREGALPWDQIEATRFRASDPLDSSIAYLTQHEAERMQEDPDILYLLAGIEAASKNRSRTTVSLNLQKRLDERERQRKDQLELENTRRRAQGLEPLASLDEMDPEERPDVLLNQATRVLSDYIALGAMTATAAANSPAGP
ncbi:MAG: carboxy terminal-processing peptidase, partial [Gammaproteobacteria bacterium]|nr:carboxy terminal-processing peptidase [Gammaproteobacteria bacterium]